MAIPEFSNDCFEFIKDSNSLKKLNAETSKTAEKKQNKSL